MWKLDRLGRNVKDLVAIVCNLEQRGVHFKSLTDQTDTATTSGRFFFHVMASLAQMERDLTVERTRAGLEAAPAGKDALEAANAKWMIPKLQLQSDYCRTV